MATNTFFQYHVSFASVTLVIEPSWIFFLSDIILNTSQVSGHFKTHRFNLRKTRRVGKNRKMKRNVVYNGCNLQNPSKVRR